MLRPILLDHYLKVMSNRGISAETVLAGTNLHSSEIGRPSLLISFQEHLKIIENMILLTGDHGLGLDIGSQSEIPNFGALGYVSLSGSTVREVLEQFRNPFIESFGILTKFVLSDDNDSKSSIITVQEPAITATMRRFCVEEALSTFLKIGSQVTKEPAPFESLYFSYSRPDYVARYKELFDCPLYFDASQTQILIKREWLDKPLPTKDEELTALYHQHLLTTARNIESSGLVCTRVLDLLLKKCDRVPSLTEAASALGLTSRSLSRQLQQEGFSYQKLLRQLRIELCKKYLESGSAGAKEIGYRLGFDDVNAFRRAFKHWTGKTVKQFKQECLPIKVDDPEGLN